MQTSIADRIGKVRRRYRFNTISRAGLTRRMRGLTVLGWDPTTIVVRAGLAHPTVTRLLCRQPDGAAAPAASVIERVLAIYDELSLTLGPSESFRGFARELGWDPPLAWDDDTIDDPTTTPQGIPDQERARRASAEPVVDEDLVQRVLACFAPDERRLAREQLYTREPGDENAQKPSTAKCGTDSGYYRHRRRLHEPACDRCLKAHAEADRRRKKKAA